MSRIKLGTPIKVSNPKTFFGNDVITPKQTHVVSGHAPGMIFKNGKWQKPQLPIFGGDVVMPPAPQKTLNAPTLNFISRKKETPIKVSNPKTFFGNDVITPKQTHVVSGHAPGMVKGKDGFWHTPDAPIFQIKLNNPLLKDELSFDNGITVDNTYYPDQPPIGFKQTTNHAKPNDGNIGINYKITVKGKVIDDTNQPMPYVEVFEEKNPSNGTITDNNGNYSLQVWALGNTVFSFATYKQTFVANSIPPILKLMPNTLDTVNLGTVNKPKMSLAGFGLVGIALLALALGGGVKNAKPQTKKATGLNKVRKPIKKTKTVIL